MTKLDITSTAVEKGLDMVKGFVEKLAGSSIEEAGLMFADKVRLRRLNNQIKILEKAKKIAEKGNIDIKQINFKVLVPLLEYSSLEEEETLQDIWARLIVNFADSSKVYESSIYPFILNQVTGKELLALKSFPEKGFSTPAILEIPLIIISNLLRLGLIETHDNGMVFLADEIYSDNSHTRYGISPLGKDFIKCCTE